MSVLAVTKVLTERGDDIDPGRNADLALLVAATNYSIIRGHGGGEHPITGEVTERSPLPLDMEILSCSRENGTDWRAVAKYNDLVSAGLSGTLVEYSKGDTGLGVRMTFPDGRIAQVDVDEENIVSGLENALFPSKAA